MPRLLLLLVLLFCQANNWAQTQNIKGKITDADSKAPLTGASISLSGADTLRGTSTDHNGNFILKQVAVGRHTLTIQFLGYETVVLKELLLLSDKELYLEVGLQESVSTLSTVEIIASNRNNQPLNEMAMLSARSMSMEELNRHAASFYDPARMALSFAGVAQAGDDVLNEISVRGNSPRGILWRLEGIEIPNPNHFPERGSSGGGISMLSTNAMATSDFFNGAFPAEYGNALSGVFDIKMRKGNFSKRETAIQLGALGFEAATEGPFSASYEGSYLLNYRYSTLGIVEQLGIIEEGEGTPDFQDASFKLHLPTKKAGNFNLFGLGGTFVTNEDYDINSSQKGKEQNYGKTGIVGLSNISFLSNKSWLKVIAAASLSKLYFEDGSYADSLGNGYQKHYDEQFEDLTQRLSVSFNHKFNNRLVMRLGGVISRLAYRYHLEEEQYTSQFIDNEELIEWQGIWDRVLDKEDDTYTLQLFGQCKHHLSPKVTLHTGLHFFRFGLNNELSVEPRLAMKWQLNQGQSISAGVGLHSKLESLPAYFVERINSSGNLVQPNRELPLQGSWHLVSGYQNQLTSSLWLNVEAYYQSINNLPIDASPGSTAAIVNVGLDDVLFEFEALSGAGKGRNYGLDISLAQQFTRQYYFQLTGSLFKSEFQTTTNQWYPTRFSSNYNLVAVGGKEFLVSSKKNKKKIVGLNGRFLLNGGLRYTAVDEAASLAQQRLVYHNTPFSEHLPAYYRFDLGIYLHISSRRMGQRILLQIQNLSNRFNLYSQQASYDPQHMKVVHTQIEQLGILPILSYRIAF